MVASAASGDLWGIPDPLFLLLYVLANAVLVLGTLLHRNLLGARSPALTPDELTPPQVAYLNGDSLLTIQAALAHLRCAQAIDVSPDGTLTATGPLPAGATSLDRAVHQAAANGVRPQQLRADGPVAAALRQLRAELERAGLLLTAAQRRANRLGPTLLVVLIVVAGVRMADTAAGDNRFRQLLFPLMFVALLAAGLLATVPRRTRAARAAVRVLHSRYPHLSPAGSPAYATYGATGAALGVALYGTAALWVLDPDFAKEAAIRPVALGGGGGSSGGSCNSYGGSSCGGGGCGGGGCGGGGGGGG